MTDYFIFDNEVTWIVLIGAFETDMICMRNTLERRVFIVDTSRLLFYYLMLYSFLLYSNKIIMNEYW